MGAIAIGGEAVIKAETVKRKIETGQKARKKVAAKPDPKAAKLDLKALNAAAVAAAAAAVARNAGRTHQRRGKLSRMTPSSWKMVARVLCCRLACPRQA